MDCPICKQKLRTTRLSWLTKLDCDNHGVIIIKNSECVEFLLMLNHPAENYPIVFSGYKDSNSIQIFPSYFIGDPQFLVKIHWIDIELDNFSEDIIKLFNKLMNLKAFA